MHCFIWSIVGLKTSVNFFLLIYKIYILIFNIVHLKSIHLLCYLYIDSLCGN